MDKLRCPVTHCGAEFLEPNITMKLKVRCDCCLTTFRIRTKVIVYDIIDPTTDPVMRAMTAVKAHLHFKYGEVNTSTSIPVQEKADIVQELWDKVCEEFDVLDADKHELEMMIKEFTAKFLGY